MKSQLHPQQQYLFGDAFPQPLDPIFEEEKLTPDEVQALIDPLIEDTPTVLLEHMGRCFKKFKRIQSLSDSAVISAADFDLDFEEGVGKLVSVERAKKATRSEFRENICWVFGLYASPSVMEFDQVCASAGQDPEWIRDGISRTFGSEIREFYHQVRAYYPDCAERMRKMLHGYVSLTQH